MHKYLIMASVSVKDILKNRAKKNYIAKAANEAVDTDKSGYMEAPELELVMNNVAVDIGSEKPTRDIVEEILKELNENGDGKLCLVEFTAFIE